MGVSEWSPRSLTDQQRELVRDNLGLVGVHLRRNVRGLGRGNREWSDLFQEGCLGLMRAATDFREGRGIPFAAFALPRIRHAVSEALRTRFGGPPAPCGADAPHEPRKGRSADPEDGPWTGHCRGDDDATSSAERARPDARVRESETIGQRLRDKYERAVRAAADSAAGSASRRGDRERLVRMLVEEHFLIPAEESRRALREIARRTRSSCARVLQCERRMAAAIGGALGGDPEFHELRRLARSEPTGNELPMDEELERRLAHAGACEFLKRYRRGDHEARGRMLQDVLAISAAELEHLIHQRFSSLPADSRERLLRGRS